MALLWKAMLIVGYVMLRIRMHTLKDEEINCVKCHHTTPDLDCAKCHIKRLRQSTIIQIWRGRVVFHGQLLSDTYNIPEQECVMQGMPLNQS